MAVMARLTRVPVLRDATVVAGYRAVRGEVGRAVLVEIDALARQLAELVGAQVLGAGLRSESAEEQDLAAQVVAEPAERLLVEQGGGQAATADLDILQSRIDRVRPSRVTCKAAGLAEEGKVVCVRLTLFAQMMQDKLWA